VNSEHLGDLVLEEALIETGRLVEGERRTEPGLDLSRRGRLGHDAEGDAPEPRVHGAILPRLPGRPPTSSVQARSVSATVQACAGQPPGW
jgi:hypothetical protein